MTKLIDLTGRKFGRWTVLGRAHNSIAGQTRWRCQCSCGKCGIVQGASLKRPSGGSCGCANIDATVARSTKHGHATNGISPTYHTWAGMKSRCTNPLHKNYSLYGGRGIIVCERWLNSFEAFLADMGEKPAKKSLDRINNDGPYSPENCRWASQKQQCRNSKINRLITCNGVTKTIIEWSELLS